MYTINKLQVYIVQHRTGESRNAGENSLQISGKQPEARKNPPNSYNQKEVLSLGREAWCASLSFLEYVGTLQM